MFDTIETGERLPAVDKNTAESKIQQLPTNHAKLTLDARRTSEFVRNLELEHTNYRRAIMYHPGSIPYLRVSRNCMMIVVKYCSFVATLVIV